MGYWREVKLISCWYERILGVRQQCHNGAMIWEGTIRIRKSKVEEQQYSVFLNADGVVGSKTGLNDLMYMCWDQIGVLYNANCGAGLNSQWWWWEGSTLVFEKNCCCVTYISMFGCHSQDMSDCMLFESLVMLLCGEGAKKELLCVDGCLLWVCCGASFLVKRWGFVT